ncbi:MAG: protein-glutamate O-methyltransferase CheR [Cytophagales bacterium]|nr:protein-glutamate O-methyltransferase CheR [Cytophagales bacterium]
MIEDIEINELRALCHAITEKYSYDFGNYAISSFKRRIIRFLELYKINNMVTLTEKVKNDSNFFKLFLNEITVNVTEMFRDPSMWRDLREKVLPNLFSTHETIKIWHAGCSSGEEVYSMCILLHENGWLDKTKIWATDIDDSILAKAKDAKFSMKNMLEVNEKNYIRYVGKSKISDYYKEVNGMAVMDTKLTRNVTFRIHDLVRSGLFNKFDLILCRNVLIYFNQQLQNEVFKLFHESLFNYGYFIIGSKETLIWSDIASKFITVNNEEKVYKKVKE